MLGEEDEVVAPDDGARTTNKGNAGEDRPREDSDALHGLCEGSLAKNDADRRKPLASRNDAAPPRRPWHRGPCQEEELRWRMLLR